MRPEVRPAQPYSRLENPPGLGPFRFIYAVLLLHFGRPVQPGRRMLPVLRLPAAFFMMLVLLIVAVVLLTTLLAIAAEPALAADEMFGTDSPLLKFVDFMVGPFAYGVVIIALVVTVGALSVGGEFSGFARRMPIVVVAGAIVILASTVIKNLFGADRAADLPIGEAEPVPRLASDTAPFHCLTQEFAGPDALPLCSPMDHGWLITIGFVLAGIGLTVLWTFRRRAAGRRRMARDAIVTRSDARTEGIA